MVLASSEIVAHTMRAVHTMFIHTMFVHTMFIHTMFIHTSHTLALNHIDRRKKDDVDMWQ